MTRQYGVDLARCVAAYLVLFGHFVLSGTFNDVDRTWVGSEALPILGKDGQSLWMIDIYLLQHWGSASAILGVALFFLVSGWVVPPMLHRYSRRQFLINRFFRICPMLFFSVTLAALIQYWFGDRSLLDASAIFSTLTLTNQFTGYPMTLGVVWTLMIEIKFYLLLALVGRLSVSKIAWTCVTLLFALVVHFTLNRFGVYSASPRLFAISNAMIHDFCFLIFMLIGSTAWLIYAERNIEKKRIATLLSLIFLFNLFRMTFSSIPEAKFLQDLSLFTQLVTFLFFALCIVGQGYLSKDSAFSRVISPVSDYTYSLYLLHVSCGLFLLSKLRHETDNQYLLLLVVTLAVSLIAATTYRLVERPGNRLGRHLLSRTGR